MTEELKQAAQAALDQLEFLNACYPHKTATDAADALRRALTQRPAAQTEREALRWTVYVEPVAVSGEPDAHRLRASIGNQAFHIGPDYMDTKQEAELFAEMFLHAIEVGHRASLPAPQQATPDQFADASKMVPPVALRSVHLTRDTAGMCVVRVNGRVAIRDNGDIIDHTATLEWFADTQQATPTRATREAEQRARMQARLATRHEGKATADFDLPPPNDAIQQATPEPVGEPRQFPVLKGKTLFSVPWSMLVPHERQARANHGQSLERLAERGGLSPVEMVAVVLGKRWRDVEGMSAADAEASLSKMVTAQTHPAPGVPEGFTLDQIADACVLAEVSDSKFESISIALAAAQAKGAGQ